MTRCTHHLGFVACLAKALLTGLAARLKGGAGLRFRAFAVAPGSCAANFRNPASQPLLDCQRLKTTFAP